MTLRYGFLPLLDQKVQIFSKNLTIADAENSARLHLKLYGFSRQTVVPVANIVAAIDMLPTFHLAGLREICYEPELVIDPFYFSGIRNSRRQAEFIQAKRKIVFFEINDPGLFYHVLYHEIGHFVFYLALSSVIKKIWVTEIFPHSTCATLYGKLNASEDFAESYACYCRDEETLQRIPTKYAFFRDYVFSGRPEIRKESNV